MRPAELPGGGADLADPAALDRIARAIEVEARHLREAARPYGQAARNMIWRGPAAKGFQDQVQTDWTQLDHLARKLEQLAGAIRKGAGQVREELERRRREAEDEAGRRRKAAREEAERRSKALASRMARLGF